MGVYIPLKVRLAKASIPQVVAYIQTYLEENPIPAMDTFAELIAEFLADHPELVAVASVNAKTGAVILTGADIMLNADADVTLATEVTNLNTMISSLSSQVAQAVTTVGGFETDIEDINSDIDTINVALDTKDTEIYQINQTLSNHLNGINANNTKNAQQDTRLTAVEGDISTLEAYNTSAQQAIALHTQQITALQGMIGDTTEILERLEEVEQTAENAQTAVSSMQTSVSTLETNQLYIAQCQIIIPESFSIPARSQIRFDIDTSNIPASATGMVRVWGYSGSPNCIITHSYSTYAYIFNLSDSAVTSLQPASIYVFYKMG